MEPDLVSFQFHHEENSGAGSRPCDYECHKNHAAMAQIHKKKRNLRHANDASYEFCDMLMSE